MVKHRYYALEFFLGIRFNRRELRGRELDFLDRVVVYQPFSLEPSKEAEQGPALTGAWSDSSFEVQSEIYATSGVSGTQQVVLKNGVISDDGETLSGEYKVTLWGLTPDPLTLSGDFSLMRVDEFAYPVYMPLVFGGQ